MTEETRESWRDLAEEYIQQYRNRIMGDEILEDMVAFAIKQEREETIKLCIELICAI